MNETIQVLMNRKSVRVFEDKEITPEIKDIILAAAMRAPTGGNCMPYSIIDVTDQSIKDKLAETYLFQCLHCGKHLVWMDFD